MGHRKRGRAGPLGVCSNGAAVVDTSSMEVIEVQTMQAEVTGGLVTVVREVFPGVLFAVEEMETFTYETGFLDPSWNWDEGSAQVDDIVTAVSSGCVKLIARRPGWPAGALLAELQDQFLETVHVTSSGLDWVEMAPPGITKAHAVQRVCDRLGVGVAEVLAIGDNYNDLTVLAWAGRTAAPANAIPEVLAIVQQVLPSNKEDGVARLLENLAEQGTRTRATRSRARLGPKTTARTTAEPSLNSQGPAGGNSSSAPSIAGPTLASARRAPSGWDMGTTLSATTSVRLCVLGPTRKNRLLTLPVANNGSPAAHCSASSAGWKSATGTVSGVPSICGTTRSKLAIETPLGRLLTSRGLARLPITITTLSMVGPFLVSSRLKPCSTV